MWYMMSASSEDVITTALSRQFEAVSDALATGCVLAGTYNWLGTKPRYQAFIRSPYFLLVLIIGGLLPTLVFLKSQILFFVASQSILNITIALCIERCVRYPHGFVGAVLNATPVAAIGVLSYSLYLWQEPFLNIFRATPLTTFPMNLLLVICSASLSYYLVERPFLRLKDRFEGRSSGAGRAASRPPVASVVSLVTSKRSSES
jgi:peptidoglycan/LPS O-acetylase OafA/YrhL